MGYGRTSVEECVYRKGGVFDCMNIWYWVSGIGYIVLMMIAEMDWIV